MECECSKCGGVKEIVALVDGLPWCEDCFDAALEVKEDHHDSN